MNPAMFVTEVDVNVTSCLRFSYDTTTTLVHLEIITRETPSGPDNLRVWINIVVIVVVVGAITITVIIISSSITIIIIVVVVVVIIIIIIIIIIIVIVIVIVIVVVVTIIIIITRKTSSAIIEIIRPGWPINSSLPWQALLQREQASASINWVKSSITISVQDKYLIFLARKTDYTTKNSYAYLSNITIVDGACSGERRLQFLSF